MDLKEGFENKGTGSLDYESYAHARISDHA